MKLDYEKIVLSSPHTQHPHANKRMLKPRAYKSAHFLHSIFVFCIQVLPQDTKKLKLLSYSKVFIMLNCSKCQTERFDFPSSYTHCASSTCVLTMEQNIKQDCKINTQSSYLSGCQLDMSKNVFTNLSYLKLVRKMCETLRPIYI